MDDQVPRRERKKAQTRKALLDVALRLIAERGIYGTRIEDITEKSDLGKGAFYNYFASKNALVAALVGEGVGVLCDEYLAPIAALAHPADRIAPVIRGHEAFFSDHPVFVVLFHQARGIAKVGAEGDDLQKVFGDYLRRIADLIVAPEHHRATTETHRMDLAAVILGSIAGYRSFRIAAGLGLGDAALLDVLTSGVPSVLGSRKA